MKRLWLLAAVIAGLVAPPGASAASIAAHDAAAFRDSVGVGTHITYYSTAYGDWPLLVSKLEELGVDHLRDGIYANPDWGPWNERYYRAVELAASRGLTFLVGMGEPGYTAGTLDELIAVAGGRLRHAIDGLEAPNEYDNFHAGPDWPTELRAYQEQLYTKAKAHPTLSDLPVIGPSLVRRESRDLLGSLEAFVDIGNVHPYTGGLPPTQEHLQREAELAAKVSGSKPLYATEVGFHNALNATVGQPPVSESVAASYLLRTYLEHFRAGVRRTYVYELIDWRPEPELVEPDQHFGLLRSDYSEKPAFVALKNLLQLVGRPAPVPTPESLELELGGDTAGLQHLLLQSGPERYKLILWRSDSEWDRVARAPLTPHSGDVTLTLPTGATAAAARPTVSAALAPAPGPVTVAADPVVVEISVPGAVPADPAAPAPEESVSPTPPPASIPGPAAGCRATALRAGEPRLSLRVRRPRTRHRRVRLVVCGTHNGTLRIKLRDRRLLAERRVRLEGGRRRVVRLRPRVALAAASERRPVRVRVRYRPRGADGVIALTRRLPARRQR